MTMGIHIRKSCWIKSQPILERIHSAARQKAKVNFMKRVRFKGFMLYSIIRPDAEVIKRRPRNHVYARRNMRSIFSFVCLCNSVFNVIVPILQTWVTFFKRLFLHLYAKQHLVHDSSLRVYLCVMLFYVCDSFGDTSLFWSENKEIYSNSKRRHQETTGHFLIRSCPCA
jgi:hypothetical protein